MLTRHNFRPPPQASSLEDLSREVYELRRQLADFFKRLNAPGGLVISQADINSTPIGRDAPDTGRFTTLESTGLITATNGQIKFPATQNASSDANTLDDYEEGDWTPVFTFATAGDLNVVYSVQQGNYTKVGRLVVLDFNLVTSTFTHTTAAGAAQITGQPFAASSATNYNASGNCFWAGITKANYTDLAPQVSAAGSVIGFVIAGSGQAAAQLAAGDMPTGGTVRFRGTLIYRV